MSLADTAKNHLPDRLGGTNSNIPKKQNRHYISSEDDDAFIPEMDSVDLRQPLSPLSPEGPAVGSLSSSASTSDVLIGSKAGTHAKSGIGLQGKKIAPHRNIQSKQNSSVVSDLEQKLVQELKHCEEGEEAAGNIETHTRNAVSVGTFENEDPAAHLVTELFESIKAKSLRDTSQEDKTKSPLLERQQSQSQSHSNKEGTPTDFKANLKKVQKKKSQEEEEENVTHIVDFKSSLKKSEHQKGVDKDQHGDNIVDFKARLKKAYNATPTNASAMSEKNVDFKARLRKVSGNKPVVKADEACSVSPTQVPESEGKRKSTGSISSLRKMWEGSQPTTPVDENGDRTVKFEKRVWPPVPSTETEKPMVPVKPTMKACSEDNAKTVSQVKTPPAPMVKAPLPPSANTKPAPTTKPPAPKEKLPIVALKNSTVLANIYAAPVSNIQQNKAKSSKTNTELASSGDSGIGPTCPLSSNSRLAVLKCVQELQDDLDQVSNKGKNQIGRAELRQLSDKVSPSSTFYCTV
jgi:hypothetical protein